MNAPKGAATKDVSGGGAIVVPVTPAQQEQIEAAFRICSFGARKITGPWVARFNSIVAEILGFDPPEHFTLAALSEQQS